MTVTCGSFSAQYAWNVEQRHGRLQVRFIFPLKPRLPSHTPPARAQVQVQRVRSFKANNICVMHTTEELQFSEHVREASVGFFSTSIAAFPLRLSASGMWRQVFVILFSLFYSSDLETEWINDRRVLKPYQEGNWMQTLPRSVCVPLTEHQDAGCC